MNNNFLFRRAIKSGSEIINYQTVRWRRPRKPFWLGLARSKMFVIRQPKYIPSLEEEKIYNALKRKYNTEYKSLLNFMRNEDPRLKLESVGSSAIGENESVGISEELREKISKSLKTNEEWNAESKRLGEEWMKRLIAQEEEKALHLHEQEEKHKQSELKKIEEVVRKEKILSENYITPDNIDEAIDKCLENVEEFDFAIDLQGNRYPGREPFVNVSTQTKAQFQEMTVTEKA